MGIIYETMIQEDTKTKGSGCVLQHDRERAEDWGTAGAHCRHKHWFPGQPLHCELREPVCKTLQPLHVYPLLAAKQYLAQGNLHGRG